MSNELLIPGKIHVLAGIRTPDHQAVSRDFTARGDKI